MRRPPIRHDRLFALLVLLALAVYAGLFGVDQWGGGRSVDSLTLSGGAVAAPVPAWKILLFLFGPLAVLLCLHGAARLIQGRRQAESRLALHRLVVDQVSEAMILTDAGQRIVSVNAAFERVSGYAAGEVLGKTPTMLSAEHPGLAFHRNIWDFVAGKGYWEGEVWDRRKDGSLYPKQMRISAICEDGLHISHFVAVFSDVSEARAQAERLDFLLRHDPLTHLPNRPALDAYLASQLEIAVPGIHRLALLIIDLDNFKTVNDSLGHHAGDRLLMELARRMAVDMGKTNRLFRLGGDEFVVVAEQFRDEATLVEMVENLFVRISQPYEVDGRVLHTKASIGISLYPEDGRDAPSLIRHADAAMYHAKSQGRNNYAFFTPAMSAAVNNRLHLETELWGALAENQLILHYQPQIDLLSGQVVGVEALVRWRHPTRGLVPPGEFIPVAEECGLILPLGHWVLRTACRQVREWLDAGINMGEMAVNISAHQFRQPNFAKSVQAILDETGIPGYRLELEITESAIMHAVDASVSTLEALKAMGIKLAIDDFGTGYSSLAYLRRFPLDRLKIDRSFLADVETDRNAAALVTSIVMLGRSLGLQLVAEGVENAAQARFLCSLECERVQGFHFHQPVSAEDVVGVGRWGMAMAPA